MNSRRTFLKYSSGIAAIPLLDVLGTNMAWAAGEVRISEDDPLAVAFRLQARCRDRRYRKVSQKGSSRKCGVPRR